MTTPKDKLLLELADRCEKAAGPDRELDAVIWLHLPEQESHAWKHEGDEFSHAYQISGADFIPKFTASLDAAMTLVPEGQSVRMGTNSGAPWAQCRRHAMSECFNGSAATLALCICAAALRSIKE